MAAKRTASEREEEMVAMEAAKYPRMRLETIIGNRKKGSKSRTPATGPIGAPEEDGILLTGTIRGIWATGHDTLCIATSVTGQSSVVTVTLVPPYERIRKPIEGREMYVDPLVYAGDTMFFGGSLYRGCYASTLDGPSFQFAKGIDILMAIATSEAGYLVGLTKSRDYCVGGSSGPTRLRIVRLTSNSCSEWEQGEAATAPWMEPFVMLLGPPSDDVPSWKKFEVVYEQLRGIFALAHQRMEPFGGTISITMHLNDYPEDVVSVVIHVDKVQGELPGLLLPGVECTVSRRGMDGTYPRTNTKHSNGLLFLSTGDVWWTEAGCLRRYSGYYAPFDTTAGATTLPDLPRE